MKLHVLFKLILATLCWGLLITFPATAELDTHRSYYSIQVMSGTLATVKSTRVKLQHLPFARIEKYADQHKLRFGFWGSEEEAENQLVEIKIHFPDAFVLATEYKPSKILLGWSGNFAKSPEKPTSMGKQSIKIQNGLIKPLPVPSNVVSTTVSGSGVLIGTPSALSNIVSVQKTTYSNIQSGLIKPLPVPSNIVSTTVSESGVLIGTPSASSNIASMQKTTYSNATTSQLTVLVQEGNWTIPAEPAAPAPSPIIVAITEPAKTQRAAMPDETQLWQLLHDEQYNMLQAEINRIYMKYDKWQPPQELLNLLQQGKLRQKIEQAIQNKDATALIHLGELHPEYFSCLHVDWTWTLAGALAMLEQTDTLRLILHRLIPDCSEQDRLATLYKAKTWLDNSMWETLLEREAKAVRSTEGESKFRRLRYDHKMEKLLAAHQMQNRIVFSTLLLQLSSDIEHYRDADAALLSGWHYFNTQETTTASLWFNKALAWQPELHDAHKGLALIAIQDKRFADAQRFADALPADSEGKQELLRAVSTAIAPGTRVLVMTGGEANTGNTNSAAYVGVIMPIHSRLGSIGNGIVQRLWVDRLTYSFDNGDQKTQAKQLY